MHSPDKQGMIMNELHSEKGIFVHQYVQSDQGLCCKIRFILSSGSVNGYLRPLSNYIHAHRLIWVALLTRYPQL